MQQFTIDLQKLRSFRIRQTSYITFYLVVEFLLLSLLILPLLKSSTWTIDSWWKFLYITVLIGSILLAVLTIRLLIKIQQYTNVIGTLFLDSELKLEDDSIQVETGGEVHSFKLNRMKVTNLIVNGNSRHPLFGHGVLVIEGSYSLILPTIVFNTRVGAFRAREVIKPIADSYVEQRISMKDIMVKLKSREDLK
tara:strand:+ start:237 stop:818 length:582 start_codon:yes stop_codon:yes gene_type:complete